MQAARIRVTVVVVARESYCHAVRLAAVRTKFVAVASTLAYLLSKHGIAPDDPGIAAYAEWHTERRELMFSAFLRFVRRAPFLRRIGRLRIELRRRASTRDASAP